MLCESDRFSLYLCFLDRTCVHYVCVMFKLLYKAGWQNQSVTTMKPLIYHRTTQLSACVYLCVCVCVCVCLCASMHPVN